MFVPLRWALYVDGIGFARRRFLGWDQWSWSDFASGRILKQGGLTLVDPERPWWRRHLILDFLAEEERKGLARLINQHYRQPDPPMLPEKLQIKFGFRRQLELHRHEIRLMVRGETFCFGWRDVQRLRITRAEETRRDFAGLSIWLPGHEIAVGCHKEKSHWSGASAEELSQYLLKHTPGERVDIDIFGECPRRAEDVQKELAKISSLERQTRICLWACGLLSAGLLAYLAIESGVMKALIMGGLVGCYALIIVAVYYVSGREIGKRTAQLELWLGEFRDRREPSLRTPVNRL